MDFKYSCFISYKTSTSKRQKEFIDLFKLTLQDTLSDYTALKTFIDSEDIDKGSYIVENIREALLNSVCMVILFIPRYFSINELYCTKEFLFMKKIEEERFKLFKKKPKNSFIIPIICKGREHYPKQLTEICFDDFSKDLVKPKFLKRISKKKKFISEFETRINNITNYIYKQFKVLINYHMNPDFNNLQFPADEDAKNWLRKNYYNQNIVDNLSAENFFKGAQV